MMLVRLRELGLRPTTSRRISRASSSMERPLSAARTRSRVLTSVVEVANRDARHPASPPVVRGTQLAQRLRCNHGATTARRQPSGGNRPTRVSSAIRPDTTAGAAWQVSRTATRPAGLPELRRCRRWSSRRRRVGRWSGRRTVRGWPAVEGVLGSLQPTLVACPSAVRA